MVDVSDWRPYKYGENLDIAGGGADPTMAQGSPYLGSLDDSVLFNAADYYQASNNAFADITTEDFVFETVIKWSATATPGIFNKRSGAGYRVYSSAGKARMNFYDGIAVINTYSATLIHGVWYHLLCFVKRNGFSQWYVDAVASGAAVNASGAAGSLSSATPFLLGTTTGIGSYDSNIAWAALWKRTAWLDTHLQATVARSRANLVQGVTPYMARGTALPTVQTRASLAHLDKIDKDGVTKYYHMGSGAMRLSDRVGTNGKRLRGYLPEPQSTNLITESSDFTSWTKNDPGDTFSSGSVGPLSSEIGHICDATIGIHQIKCPVNHVMSNGVQYVHHAIIKAAADDWVALYDSRGEGRYFNVADGSIGAVLTGAPDDSYIVSLKDGWFLIAIVTTGDGSARNTRLYPSSGNGVVTTSGDGVNPNLWYAHAQLEIGTCHTSPIATDGGAAIREEDDLRFNSADGNIGGVGSNRAGEFRCRVLLPSYASTVAKTWFTLTDGGSSVERIRGQVNTSSQPVSTSPTQWSVVGTTDMASGSIVKIRQPWQTDLASLYINGSEEGVRETTCIPPDELDRLHIGEEQTVVTQFSGLVADMEWFERVQREA